MKKILLFLLLTVSIAAQAQNKFRQPVNMYDTLRLFKGASVGKILQCVTDSGSCAWVTAGGSADTTWAWSLHGNSNTDPSVNFIGTTDSVDLVFKADGIRSGWIDVDFYNITLGINALQSITSGSENIAIGYEAMNNLTNSLNNIAIGSGTGSTLLTGDNNTLIGGGADVATSSTQNSIAIGSGANAATNQFALSSSITNLQFNLNGQTNGYVLTTNGTTADWQPVLRIGNDTLNVTVNPYTGRIKANLEPDSNLFLIGDTATPQFLAYGSLNSDGITSFTNFGALYNHEITTTNGYHLLQNINFKDTGLLRFATQPELITKKHGQFAFGFANYESGTTKVTNLYCGRAITPGNYEDMNYIAAEYDTLTGKSRCILDVRPDSVSTGKDRQLILQQQNLSYVVAGATISTLDTVGTFTTAKVITAVQYNAPSTGATVNSDGSPQLILNPASTIATLTVAFPTSPVNGQLFNISSTQVITSLTLTSSATILGTLTTIALDGCAGWVYSSTIPAWVKAHN